MTNSPNTECHCKEMTCQKGCSKKHTHKGFSCEKCVPKPVLPNTECCPCDLHKPTDDLRHKFADCPIHQPTENWEKELRSLWQTTRENEGKYEKVKNLITSLLASHNNSLVERLEGAKRDESFKQDADWKQNEITKANILHNAGITEAQELIKNSLP